MSYPCLSVVVAFDIPNLISNIFRVSSYKVQQWYSKVILSFRQFLLFGGGETGEGGVIPVTKLPYLQSICSCTVLSILSIYSPISPCTRVYDKLSWPASFVVLRTDYLLIVLLCSSPLCDLLYSRIDPCCVRDRVNDSPFVDVYLCRCPTSPPPNLCWWMGKRARLHASKLICTSLIMCCWMNRKRRTRSLPERRNSPIKSRRVDRSDVLFTWGRTT